MAFGKVDLSRDNFLGGRLSLFQPRRGYRAGADPVLLAAAVPARPGQAVLELGCGAGVAVMCLGVRVPGLALHGVELQEDYAALARRNAGENGLELAVFTADLRALPPDLRARSFDHVLANPPYFQPGRGTPAADAGRANGRAGETRLSDWVDAATRRLCPGGYLTLIQRAARLPDLLSAMDGRLGSVAVKPLAPRVGRAAELVIVQARKGGRAAFRLLAPLVLHEGARHERDEDSYTREVQAILREAAPLEIV